jgi:hypothetical protein
MAKDLLPARAEINLEVAMQAVLRVNTFDRDKLAQSGIAVGEACESKAGAKNGVASVQQNAANATVFDLTE